MQPWPRCQVMKHFENYRTCLQTLKRNTHKTFEVELRDAVATLCAQKNTMRYQRKPKANPNISKGSLKTRTRVPRVSRGSPKSPKELQTRSWAMHKVPQSHNGVSHLRAFFSALLSFFHPVLGSKCKENEKHENHMFLPFW